MQASLPVIVIGAGPVGLAAAAQLLARGVDALVLEAGEGVGASVRQWAHVRMFSPWEFNLDRAAVALLDASGWSAPDPAAFPTGGELVDRYLAPLARVPAIAARLRISTRVLAVSRLRRDRMKDARRDDTPFVLRVRDARGDRDLLARAVIDASGTFGQPNPLGASGLPALGESEARDAVAYGLPDVLGTQRARYAGKRVLVVGSGHSAFNVLNDLARLAESVPGTRVSWAIRRESLRRVLGGGDNDQLRERGQLGLRVARLVETGALQVETGFELERIERTAEGLVAHGGSGALAAVDEIVGATGFRPDLSLLSELRIALDHGTQAPVALAPLIDPNLHSCGSVRPHGAQELAHPERDVYVVGMKSYGRAPTFLLATGYEQVRSVAAELAGDHEAARRVELALPETGVCITDFVDEPQVASACGTGCATKDAAPEPRAVSAGCGQACSTTDEAPELGVAATAFATTCSTTDDAPELCAAATGFVTARSTTDESTKPRFGTAACGTSRTTTKDGTADLPRVAACAPSSATPAGAEARVSTAASAAKIGNCCAPAKPAPVAAGCCA